MQTQTGAAFAWLREGSSKDCPAVHELRKVKYLSVHILNLAQ